MTGKINEDYVSFETAKLLKDKGFNECPLNRYDDCGYLWVQGGYNKTIKWHFPAPTLQMAMKWLRRIHNVNIDIVSIWNRKQFEYQVFVVTPEKAKDCYVDNKLYLSYEEACEAAIQYCLEKLIK